jgi:nucleotidyltransferase substrate binding protein (TIGR01987 family)
MRNNSDFQSGSERARLLFSDFARAIERLEEALAKQEDEFLRDACIQRFEFTFELAWKGIQAIARPEGQECATPKSAFSLGWQARWIEDEDLWLDMLDARNKTSHTYREKTAEEVYSALPRFIPALKQLARTLETRLRNP